MGKVKESYRKSFTWQGEPSDSIVYLDVADDAEGYGVVFGGDETDRTVAFGEGEFALALAYNLFNAIRNELNHYEEGTDLVTIQFEHEQLESLYCWETKRLIPTYDYFKELVKIVTYIDKWYAK